ncbi:MAG TPA: LAGLIDADG family homing endonuclease [Patescibacteria group bacterium]|nr:LAGLIDADG family homing endonuclease [Patescibacteria group bacterium]
MKQKFSFDNKSLSAYVIGLALGDGNLSNPNGRTTRLRITCDLKYPILIQKIQKAVADLLPNNKVSIVRRNIKSGNCVDISCYSNHWEKILGWSAHGGPKLIQNISIPNWIKEKKNYKINCLRGLIETDGSIYKDRNYKTVMFTNSSFTLIDDVYKIIKSLNFTPHLYKADNNGKNPIYRIRISRDVQEFIDLIKPEKAEGSTPSLPTLNYD